MANYLIDFLRSEVKHDRLPKNLLPLQSGIGNVANAVLAGLQESEFRNLTSFTEVVQDNLLSLLEEGTFTSVSATALSLTLSLIHISEPTRHFKRSRMPSSA